MGHIRIGDLARETGVSVRLLRYYEAQGLISSQRTSGGHREFTVDATESVARIRLLLAAGLPTKVIRDVIPCFIGSGSDLDPCVVDHLRARMTELDTRISDLTRARSALGDLLEASAPAPARENGRV